MRKRILALLMALVMVFGLNTTVLAAPGDSATVDNTVETEVPSEVDIEWTSNWSIVLNHVGADADYVEYAFTIYKDGVAVDSFEDYWWGETESYGYNCTEYITESGTYQVKVEAEYRFDVYDEETDSYKSEYKTIKGETEAVAYTKPGKALAVPANIKIENGILSFDTVADTNEYLVTFYNKEVENGNTYSYGSYWYAESGSVSINLKNWFSGYPGDMDVYVTVQAISDDINTICNSSESALVGPYEYRIEKKATTITWSTEELATAIVGNLSEDANRVDYNLYISKNGVEYGSRWSSGYTNELTYIDLTNYLRSYGAGTYLAELEAREYGIDADNIYTVLAIHTAESNYAYAPANTLATPGNAALSTTNKLTFNTVENAEYYQVYYRIETPNSGEVYESTWTSLSVAEGETTGSYDATELLEEIEYWYEDTTAEVIVSIGIRAITGDIKNTASSEAVWFEVLNTVKTAEEAEKALDEALKDVEKNPEAVQNVLVNTSNDVLVELLKDAEFVEKIVKAEAAYVEAMKINVVAPKSDVATVDATKITVVGAALNAAFGEDVQLTVAKPAKEVTVPTGYRAGGVQLDINLLVDGESLEELDVPVTITMPIPAGVNTKNLVILHYHGDATTPTIITPVVNADGTMTFTVTGFSTFVITNSNASPATADASVATVCAIMVLAAAAVVVMRKRNVVK